MNQSMPGWMSKQAVGITPFAPFANSYRSIWISDFHLGTRGCKAAALEEFLRSVCADNLYLVGDIIDGWSLGPSWYWSAAQHAVVKEIVAWRRRGARVVFIPGNHDQVGLIESLFGLVPHHGELIHVTADGARMLVMHGHQFDSSFSSARWLSMMGSKAYAAALRINEWYCRERFGLEHAGGLLTGYLKSPVRSAMRYLTAIELDERALVGVAREYKADGIICGHAHRAEQRLIGPVWYINDGDWVENCTALAESHDGALNLIRWHRGGNARLESVPSEARSAYAESEVS